MSEIKTKTQVIPSKILSRKDEITADFIALAEKHIDELMAKKAPKRLSASNFAGQLFIHPRHLTNTLHLTMNSSPCDYMEKRILEESKKMLSETSLSIADIGQYFAYDEPTNFIKFFKGMAGITPLQYRKSLISGT
jgi:AraC-like DNA-binding protein